MLAAADYVLLVILALLWFWVWWLCFGGFVVWYCASFYESCCYGVAGEIVVCARFINAARLDLWIRKRKVDFNSNNVET